jgi:hypothetical protein
MKGKIYTKQKKKLRRDENEIKTEEKKKWVKDKERGKKD